MSIPPFSSPKSRTHSSSISHDVSSKSGTSMNTNLKTTEVSKILTIGNFRLGKTIGVGSFGKVKIAEHLVTGHKVAVKILNRKKIKSLRMDLKIRREISNMKMFRHPHIIRLYEVIESTTDIFMVMEYVPGGELFDYIVTHGKLSENIARHFFQQIISGVDYCHQHMVVHRDLKPENLLIDSHNDVKIADFGLSTMMSDGDFLKTSCGSPNYAAPEVISGKLYAGPEVDCWSCGVILYTLVCAKLPFDDEYIPTLFKKIRAGTFEIPSYVSPLCRDLISSMLVVDPLKRITINEIKQHAWFSVNLPAYLFPSVISSKITENINEFILEEISVKYQVDKAYILEAIHLSEETGEPNEFVVAYSLISDHQRAHIEKPLANISPAALATSPPMNLRDEIPFDFDDDTNNNEDDNAKRIFDGKSGLVSRFTVRNNRISQSESKGVSDPKKKLWYLGVLSSRPPNEIMKDVFRALKVTGFQWKVLSAYQLRCRAFISDSKAKTHDPTPMDISEPISTSVSSENAISPQNQSSLPSLEHNQKSSSCCAANCVKLALQLYKVKDKKYLLDIKKLDGDTFPFFDLCSKFLNELRI